jgi:hypothetical protein
MPGTNKSFTAVRPKSKQKCGIGRNGLLWGDPSLPTRYLRTAERSRFLDSFGVGLVHQIAVGLGVDLVEKIAHRYCVLGNHPTNSVRAIRILSFPLPFAAR